MQSSRRRDLGVGLFVLVGIAGLAYLSVQVGGLSYTGPGGLRLFASFDEVGGLGPRAPVRISGVTVGQVVSVGLGDDLRARVVLDVDRHLELSVDTVASIRTDGLLGDQYVSLEPGGEEALLQSGEEISFTESALNLEKLIGRFVHDTSLEDGE